MDISFITPLQWYIFSSMLLSLIALIKSKSKIKFYIFLLLAFSFCIEVLGSYYNFVLDKENGHIYNWAIVGIFTFWILILALSDINHKIIYWLAIGAILILSARATFFVEKTKGQEFDTHLFILSASIFTLLLLRYFFIAFNKSQFKLLKLEYIILYTGPFMYYCGLSIFFSVYNIADVKSFVVLNKIDLRHFIIHPIDILYYSCINIYSVISLKQKHE